MGQKEAGLAPRPNWRLETVTFKSAPAVHDAHDTDDRLTACGRKWSALPVESQEGAVTCRTCIRNVRATWRDRG